MRRAAPRPDTRRGSQCCRRSEAHVWLSHAAARSHQPSRTASQPQTVRARSGGPARLGVDHLELEEHRADGHFRDHRPVAAFSRSRLRRRGSDLERAGRAACGVANGPQRRRDPPALRIRDGKMSLLGARRDMLDVRRPVLPPLRQRVQFRRAGSERAEFGGKTRTAGPPPRASALGSRAVSATAAHFGWHSSGWTLSSWLPVE